MTADEARLLMKNSKYGSHRDVQILVDRINEQIKTQANQKLSYVVVNKISYGDVISLSRIYKENNFKVTDCCAGDDGESPPQTVYDLIIQW